MLTAAMASTASTARKRGAVRRNPTSRAALERELAQRTRELDAARQQLAATADVLKTISRAPFHLQPVLELLTVSAAQLCEADMAGLTRPDEDGLFRYETNYRYSPDWLEYVNEIRFGPERGSVVGRTLAERRPLQLDDVFADPEYGYGDLARRGGFRTLLGVPLMRQGEPIGVLVLGRKTVRPFSEREITMLTTFADQAVIAIENVRLMDELQEKTRELEAADRYKSHFLASASHDLRQPLHALNLFVTQLADGGGRGRRQVLVNNIQAAVTSMNELFGSLLDMAKLEAGIVEPHLDEFPLDRAMERVAATFATLADEKGLGLNIHFTGAWVRSDLVLLERILLNFVSNAVHYTRRGRVVVGCRRKGSRLRIDVYNTGEVIPEGEQERIFAEYYRGSGGSGGSQGGFGLGLAIVNRLAKMLDHVIELESAAGHPTRFSVLVPRVATPLDRRNHEDDAGVADPLKGRRVLVVDDDALVLEAMGGVLSSWGCVVETAESESAAMECLPSLAAMPDLIISDYRMSDDRTGIDIIESVRATVGSMIPALLVSGDTSPETLQAADAAGLRLLHKPVSPLRLRVTVSGLLRSA